MERKRATKNGDYVDLYIVDNDIALDDQSCPQHVDGRASIAQDIKHMIRDTGLLFGLIGQRDYEERQRVLILIVLEVEKDDRIIPGTVKIQEADIETFWLTAKTVKYHDIGVYI